MSFILENTPYWIAFMGVFWAVIAAKKAYHKIYPSRKAAFRAAKRANGIPMSMQPSEIIRPTEVEKLQKKKLHLDKRNIRLYIFSWVIEKINKIEERKIYIREDKSAEYGEKDGKGDQLPHFNAGEDPDNLKQHYYYKTLKTKWKRKSIWQKIYTLTKLLIWFGMGMSVILLIF
jgi:hypothetical protein